MGEKSLGENRGRWDAGFRSPLLRYIIYILNILYIYITYYIYICDYMYIVQSLQKRKVS